MLFSVGFACWPPALPILLWWLGHSPTRTTSVGRSLACSLTFTTTIMQRWRRRRVRGRCVMETPPSSALPPPPPLADAYHQHLRQSPATAPGAHTNDSRIVRCSSSFRSVAPFTTCIDPAARLLLPPPSLIILLLFDYCRDKRPTDWRTSHTSRFALHCVPALRLCVLLKPWRQTLQTELPLPRLLAAIQHCEAALLATSFVRASSARATATSTNGLTTTFFRAVATAAATAVLLPVRLSLLVW